MFISAVPWIENDENEDMIKVLFFMKTNISNGNCLKEELLRKKCKPFVFVRFIALRNNQENCFKNELFLMLTYISNNITHVFVFRTFLVFKIKNDSNYADIMVYVIYTF